MILGRGRGTHHRLVPWRESPHVVPAVALLLLDLVKKAELVGVGPEFRADALAMLRPHGIGLPLRKLGLQLCHRHLRRAVLRLDAVPLPLSGVRRDQLLPCLRSPKPRIRMPGWVRCMSAGMLTGSSQCGTEETMQPCALHLRVISLVRRTGSAPSQPPPTQAGGARPSRSIRSHSQASRGSPCAPPEPRTQLLHRLTQKHPGRCINMLIRGFRGSGPPIPGLNLGGPGQPNYRQGGEPY